jgi:hypothetical protein
MRMIMATASGAKKLRAWALATLCLSAPLASLAQPVPCRVDQLRGLYLFSATGYTRANQEAPWVPKAILELLRINGDGTLTTPWVTVANPFGNTGLIVDRVGNPGTYSVNDDCTGLMQFADGNIFRLYVSPRGDEFWMIQTTGLGGSLNVFQGKVARVAQ